MKKLLLLLAASSVGLSLSAQESKSIVFVSPNLYELPASLANNIVTKKVSHYDLLKQAGTADKTSTIKANTHSQWFDYFDQNAVTGNTLYYYATAADSNISDIPSTGSPYHIYCHGIGMSFDPTDDHYYGNANTTPITASPITSAMPYIVDSFEVPFSYIRNNNTSAAADSLIIELMYTTMSTDSGTFKIRYGANAANAAKTTDSTPRSATCIYRGLTSSIGPNETWDSIKTVKQRYAFPLVLADTVGGSTAAHFGLSPAMNVPANAKVISFVHFKGMQSTTLASTSANSNLIHLFSGTPEATSGTWPKQTPHSTGYPGSSQTGLIAQRQVRWADTGYTFMGHNILIPGVAFNSPGLAAPLQLFHIKWTTMDEDGVVNINNTIGKVNAYPNPSSNNLNVLFELSKVSNVTVTLTNTVGQEVAAQTINNVVSGSASFNTAALASGIYFYSVISNGERSTGRITVAH